MSTKTLTSESRFLKAANANGWEVRSEPYPVWVRDPESGHNKAAREYTEQRETLPYAEQTVRLHRARRYGASDYYERKVEGVKHTATGPAGQVVVVFDDRGRYVADKSFGEPSYENRYSWGLYRSVPNPLSAVLQTIEKYAPEKVKANLEANERREREEKEREEREVAEAYAQAVKDEEEALKSLREFLATCKVEALADEDIDHLLELASTVKKARYLVSRCSIGWTPGRTSLHGRYENGKKVSE